MPENKKKCLHDIKNLSLRLRSMIEIVDRDISKVDKKQLIVDLEKTVDELKLKFSEYLNHE